MRSDILSALAGALALASPILFPGPTLAASATSSVPSYNIKAACGELSAIPEARSVDSSLPDVTSHCIDAENAAHQQLIKQWAQFPAADRTMCAGVSKAGTVDPVYTELMTCLEMARDSKQLTNQSAAERMNGTAQAVPTQQRGTRTAQNRAR
jgi:hypothetical protein